MLPIQALISSKMNCNRCYDIAVSDFVDLMERGEVRLLSGNFTAEDLELITKGVLKSTQVPREVQALFKSQE